MAPRTIYANLADGLQSFSLFDQSFTDAGSLGVIPCTAAGINAIVLTPVATVFPPNVSTPQQNQLFSFVAAGNSTGSVTIQVGTLAAKPLYRADGITQATTGDLLSAVVYAVFYNPALNSAAGGYQVAFPTSSQSIAAVGSKWINSISTSGVPTLSQPAFTDISGSVAASQMPALTGDITTSAGAVATSIGANTVTNAKLATMAAWTFKVNNTSGSATPTDVTIDGLTLKATPAPIDEFIIWDVAGTAHKKATVSSIAASSGVSSIASNTGAFTLSNGITNATNDIRLDPSFLQNFLSGLGLANNGAAPTTDIDISAGVAADSTNAALIKLTSALTKRLSVNWVVGTGQGGLDTGAVANGTYHVWLIQRSDTGVVDVLFSLSASAPTMPTSYDRKRRIGSIVRVAAAIKPFIQDGNTFQWTTTVSDLASAVNYGTARVSQTITIPLGIRVQAFGTMNINVNANTGIVITDLSATDRDPATSGGMMMFALASNANAGQWTGFSNTSAQVGVRVSTTGASIFITLVTSGYIDTRGQ